MISHETYKYQNGLHTHKKKQETGFGCLAEISICMIIELHINFIHLPCSALYVALISSTWVKALYFRLLYMPALFLTLLLAIRKMSHTLQVSQFEQKPPDIRNNLRIFRCKEISPDRWKHLFGYLFSALIFLCYFFN